MDFQDALNTVTAELTPQPWEYTAEDGTTLTVIPAGLREDPGHAEVYVRVTANKALAAQIGITTADMPGLLTALDGQTRWVHAPMWGDSLDLAFDADGGLSLMVTEVHYEPEREATVTVYLPLGERQPLASALRRALDVARGWED